jgi:hypothetical protein
VIAEQPHSPGDERSTREPRFFPSRALDPGQVSVDSDSRARLSGWRENIVVFLFFSLLTIVLTYPAAFHLGDRVIGAYRGDNFHYLWQLWYPAHAVFDLHTSPFLDPDIYVPYGFDLIRNQDLSPANVLLFMPVTYLLGEVATYNLLVLLSFPLTAFGTFLLARQLWGSRAGALLAGVIVAFCAYRVTRSTGHLTMVTTQWIPFFFLFLEETIRNPNRRNAILVGIFYAFSALATWTYAWLVAIAAVLYLGARVPWWSERRRLVPLLSSGLAAAIVALALILPFAIPYIQATNSGAVTARPPEESQAFSASIADFFVPSAFHTIWGNWVLENWRNGDNGIWLSEWQVYLGFVALAMAIVGIVAHRNRIAGALIVVAAGSFVIALGPTLYLTHPEPIAGVAARAPLSPIPLPVSLLDQIPPFRYLRGWARMGFFVELAVGLLAALGLATLLQVLGRQFATRAGTAQLLVTVGVFILAILDSLSVPFGMAEVSPRPVDTWLAQQPEKFTIMEYPVLENAYSGPAMYVTRLTGKRTVMGYASYPPNLAFWGILSHFPAPGALDLLKRWGVKYLLVDETAYRAGAEFWGVRRDWNQILPAVLASGRLREVTVRGGVHVYALVDEPPLALGTLELMRNPGFEDGTAATPVGWMAFGSVAYDHSPSNAHSGNASIAVTLKDFFVSAPVQIQAGQCYQLSVFSRADQGDSLVRLQINWLDAKGNQLDPTTAAIQFTLVDSTWEQVKTQYRAPAGSYGARAYAVAQQGRVWLDDYSLRELADGCPRRLTPP